MIQAIDLLLSRTGTSCTRHPSSQGESKLEHVPPRDLGSQLCRSDSTCPGNRGCWGGAMEVTEAELLAWNTARSPQFPNFSIL